MTMKIENEIGKLTSRLNLLENQNNRFKALLDSAIEVTKQSVSRSACPKDDDFLSKAINLIEDEKIQLQEDLNFLKKSENDSLVVNIKEIENENLELRKKVELLIEEAKKTTKDINQLKLEHSEFKFLLTQPDSNSEWLRNILMLDNPEAENSGFNLMEQRYQLQQKIFALEKRKTELLHAIEDITSPEVTPRSSQRNRKEVERVIFSAIDTVAKREYENLYKKVLDLEQERTTLLSELQLVLERSRREIADEYCNLQRKILQIEAEKAELRLTLNSLNSINEDRSENNTFFDEPSDLETPTNDDTEALDKILNAFTNSSSQINIQEAIRRENSKYRFFRASIETCTIL